MGSGTPAAHELPAAPAPAPAPERAWLTRIRLDHGSRAVRDDLRDAAALHRRVMSLVPDDLGENPRSRAGVLFRVDPDDERRSTLLVQSLLAPRCERLPRGYENAQTRSMTVMLDALRPGLVVRYRLLGNAVRRCGRDSPDGRWKQAIPLVGPEAEQWWVRRAEGAGLQLRTVHCALTDTLTAWHGTERSSGPSRPGHVPVRHRGRRYDGTAVVQDAEALRLAVLHGIGRSKSYGCGLLSLAPAPRR
ncbi:type I-E CRISPR-associated protein Cas6/Cse3/CasE [Streptomyces zhihengii]|uniref:type I-E CRISPR-associated protein Cas6/Cse3/CasE n=1 Tax=Streptomyces zhihengii TaxID=1818004 RepID=UPI0033AB8784